MRGVPALTALTLATVLAVGDADGGDWSLTNFKNLVTFGDSYTDENRLGYFISHNGSAPPVGWNQPWGLSTASGGLSWPRYTSLYSGLSLYNYAVSGAVCSNAITPRWFSSINAPFPDIAGYELPAFIADSHYRSPNGTKFFKGTPWDTVYAIWIGTNDLGNNAFLTDSQVSGKTLVDYVNCVYDTIDKLYQNGGRYFVLLNLAPLQLLPQYAVPSDGGLAATQYFPNKGPNITETSYRMWESVATVNDLFAYRTPYEVEVAGTYDDAEIAIFNVNGLLTDIHTNPSQYLNGTAPLNVTGIVNQCNLSGQDCVRKSNPDSYEWYDELHPSEQTDRVIAREFLRVLDGNSSWATYWC